MDAFTLFSRFGLALAIGLLFGLQREYAKGEGELFAGVRTFALVSLLGAATAQLTSSIDSPWPLV
ncbi:MAG TPA: MgtC/SapB family protein, partial [Candidatus Acetothermia bacterium]|nr:MgtC/SapB family protein [Candidatus Acetothermia bacterium]